MDDETLVRLARGGDLAALARLFERHRPRLLAIGRGVLGDADAAAEVAQETALVALTRLQQLDDPALVGAWLAGIARNLCRRRLRPRAYQEWSWDAIHGGRMLHDPPDTAPTPEDVAVRDDVAVRVAGAVDKLPDGQRQAVHMFYLDDLSHAEVAAALDIEVNAVKARLHRARRSLRPLVAALAPDVRREREVRPMTATDAIELHIADVRRRHIDGHDQHVVTVQSNDGEVIPIWIGPSEAIALALRLTGAALPRPLTYETMASLVRAADGRITEVWLTRLEDFTFYADVVIDGAAGAQRVDLRPSDALNIAMTVGVPIRTTRALFDAVTAADTSTYNREEFPDDATTIATEVMQQWERGIDWFKHQRHAP